MGSLSLFSSSQNIFCLISQKYSSNVNEKQCPKMTKNGKISKATHPVQLEQKGGNEIEITFIPYVYTLIYNINIKKLKKTHFHIWSAQSGRF